MRPKAIWRTDLLIKDAQSIQLAEVHQLASFHTHTYAN